MSRSPDGQDAALDRARTALLACIDENGMAPMLSRGAAVALSGGPDSVLLLCLMQEYAAEHRLPLAALHVNHGIRGEEAERDEAFCRDLCLARGVRFFSRRVDVPAYREAERLGVEEAARRLRYGAFESFLRENPTYACILTAHNATDNLETLLLHLVRGSGLRGMCGIPPVRGPYLRPLLYLAKREVLLALAALGQDYVTDSTNRDLSLARNYVRAELLSRLAPISEDPEGAVTRLTRNLRAEEAEAGRAARAALATAGRDTGLSRAALAAMGPAMACRVLSLHYGDCGGSVMLEEVHYRALLAALPGTHVATLSMPGDMSAVLDRDTLTFCKRGQEDIKTAEFSVPLSLGCNPLGDTGGEIWLFKRREAEFEKQSANVYNLFKQCKINSVTIRDSLVARNRRPGDAYRTGGMTRRVRRLLTDAGLPHRLRAVLPVVCDAEGPLWVPGFGVRDGAKATAGNDEWLYAYYVYGRKEGHD